MQQSLEPVVIDVVFQLRQKTAHQITNEHHLGLKSAQYREENRFEGSEWAQSHGLKRLHGSQKTYRNSYGDPSPFALRLC